MFYHVTEKWDGGDLVPCGNPETFAERWPDAGELAQVHAHVVHLYSNVADAVRHAAWFCGGAGDILTIDEDAIDWHTDDLEFPHPVCARVPAHAVRRLDGEVAR